jgi:hypothetical protein
MTSKAAMIVFGVALFSVIFTANGYAEWSFVYEHDEDGVPISGSIDKLRRAVARGADVKVSFSTPQLGMVNYLKCIETLLYDEGSVSCVLTPELSVFSYPSGPGLGFQPNAFWYFGIVNTLGELDSSRWSIGEHVDRGHTRDRVPAKWYVDR